MAAKYEKHFRRLFCYREFSRHLVFEQKHSNSNEIETIAKFKCEERILVSITTDGFGVIFVHATRNRLMLRVWENVQKTDPAQWLVAKISMSKFCMCQNFVSNKV